MWTPKERIKHPLPLAAAPTAAEAQASRLFSSLTLSCGAILHERTWVPAMVPWRATEEGFVTKDVLDWYARFADGEPGALVVEATGVRDVPSGPLLRIGHDRFVPGLKELVDTVRAHSRGRTRLFIQLIDFLRIRRRPSKARYLREFLAITEAHRRALEGLAGRSFDDASTDAVRDALTGLPEPDLRAVLTPRELEALEMGERERVTDTHLPHIRDLPAVLPGLFAAAAGRAQAAGFDGVELHFAHAYTMASFLSALNDRSDGYGGDRASRARLGLEVIRAVRARVGAPFAVGARFLCDDVVEGGNRVEDAAHFGVAFAREGVDFLSLSTGGRFEDAKQPKVGEAAYPYTGPSGYECMPTVYSDARGPFARNVHKQAQVRRAVRDAGLTTPIVVAGGISDFATAEAILERGDGDVVGAARQSLADPDWFAKLRAGRGAEIRRCIYKNYCEALDQKHRTVTCQLWDRSAPGEDLGPTTDGGRRRLVAPRWAERPDLSGHGGTDAGAGGGEHVP